LNIFLVPPLLYTHLISKTRYLYDFSDTVIIFGAKKCSSHNWVTLRLIILFLDPLQSYSLHLECYMSFSIFRLHSENILSVKACTLGIQKKFKQNQSLIGLIFVSLLLSNHILILDLQRNHLLMNF
jgi:hypothetical protein